MSNQAKRIERACVNYLERQGQDVAIAIGAPLVCALAGLICIGLYFKL